MSSLENKIKFVQELSKTISTFQPNIESIEYVVFKHSVRTWTQEYLVINYNGGSKTVRNCNGNSISAILKELVNYLDSGYYEEVEYLTDYENSPNWIKIDLDII